jgi:ubiquinone/menaquinone biosynthesis C-methylase UbiE
MEILGRIADKKRIKETIPYISKNMKILDLGCGDGWFTRYLNSNGYDCVGVDTELENNHPFYRGTADNIPFPDESFDCIIMIEVIEHIDPSCYGEINRVLKYGGKIILSTILPESDKLVHLASKLKLAGPYVTPHINLVHIESLPWKLIYKSRILFVDQFGVFEKI